MELNTITAFALIGLLGTAAWAPLLIDLLYKMNIVIRHRLMSNNMNAEFIKIHGHKSGTPRSGGLMISVTVALAVLLLVPFSPVRTVFLVGWVLFASFGLADDLLVSGRKVSDKFRLLQETFAWRMGKLGILYGIALLSVVLVANVLNISSIGLIGDLRLQLNVLTIPFVALGVVLAMYAFEITDGADGLVTGQFLIGFITYMVMAAFTMHYELLPLLGLVFGSALVYLYFNINPARVFMGGSGTLPIAHLLIMCMFVTDTFLPFVVMGFVYWVELFSSASQILAIRFYKRRIFRIAPIHHHFEAIGWPEAKVVQRFWLASAVAALAALWVFSLVG